MTIPLTASVTISDDRSTATTHGPGAAALRAPLRMRIAGRSITSDDGPWGARAARARHLP